MPDPSPALADPAELTRAHLVVCVDDEASILAAIQRMLRQEPYRILFTDQPRQALAWVDEHDVSVIIADQRMPGMSGTEVLRTARERSPKTIRVLLTGYADINALSDAVNGGAIRRLITKPWADADFKRTLRDLLIERELEERRGNTPPPIDIVPTLRRKNQELEEVVRSQCASLDFVRELTDRIQIPVAGITRDLMITECNTAFRRLFGEDPPAFHGWDAREMLPQDLVDKLQDILIAPHEEILRNVSLAGERVTATLKPLTRQGALLGVLLVATPESTTRYHSPRALDEDMEHESRTSNGTPAPIPTVDGPQGMETLLTGLETLLASCPDPIAVVDPTFHIRYLNNAGLRVLGRDSSAVFGREIAEIGLPVSTRDRFLANGASVLASGDAVTDETWMPTPYGQRAFEYVLSPIRRGGSGPVEALLCTVRDVTDRKRREEGLQQRNSAFETAVEGFLHADPEGRTLAINRAYATLLGYSPEELNGHEWNLMIHPDDRDKVKAAHLRMLVHGRAEIEARAVRKDGTTFSQRVLLIKSLDRKNTFIGHYCFMRDVTEQEQRTAQMLQGQKLQAVGQLAAGIAHEINNPVGYILTNLSVMRDYLEELVRDPARGAPAETVEDFRKAIADCLEGGERIRDIVKNLRDFTHVDEGKARPADLHECLENAIRMCWNELKYKAALHRKFGPLPPVVCWPQRLHQVFVNLLVNSAQAIDGRGEITLSTREEEGFAVVTLRDSGRGIAPENLGKIFEPFFTTKPLDKGTGLGLHVAYQIVKAHGGRIQAASEVGRGTVFTLHLPISGPGGSPDDNGKG